MWIVSRSTSRRRPFPRRRRCFAPSARYSATYSRRQPENRAKFFSLREATDGYFRRRILTGGDDLLLADLLEATALILRGASRPNDLDRATAHSVLQLIATSEPERTKICRNCGWLFIDRSKNRSRAWCDMAVCGNRAKAHRHYRREEGGDAMRMKVMLPRWR